MIIIDEASYCPYFTDIEIEQFKGYYSDDVLLEHPVAELDEYRAKQHDSAFEMEKLKLKLKQSKDPDEVDKIKQTMVSMGWNPEVEYNKENQDKARSRMESLINNYFPQVEIIDCTNIDENKLEALDESKRSAEIFPIHIALVRGDSAFSKLIHAATGGEYTHSAVGMGTDFSKLYSFNLNNHYNYFGGFSVETIKNYPQNNKLAIYTVFVTKAAFQKTRDTIQRLLGNIKNTGYSIKALLAFPFSKVKISNGDTMICSQFVDFLFKSINIDFSKSDSSKVSPTKLHFFIRTNKKVYKTYEGLVKDFNPKKINDLIGKLSKKAIVANEAFIQPVIEARDIIPIEVKDNGDVLLTNPFPNFNDEYFNSHNLLISYEQSGNIEGMKYELARLYYMNYVLEKKLYHNKMLSNKQENIKTRARILNDFKKYLKYVNSKDAKFNFSTYYEQSPFYHNTVQIKGSTIGKIKDLISYIL